MGATITVRVRGLVLAAATAVALVAAYLVGSGTGGPATASTTEPRGDAAGTRTIVMTGTGEATGVPDQLTFRLSVRKKAWDVSDALAAANATMRRVLTALEGEGVAKRDVQTTGLAIRPEYDYRSDGTSVLTGYAATESAAVLVRDLHQSGKALAAVANAGGNSVRVQGIGLRIGDHDDLTSRARDAAVATAQAKAEQYAEATGQALGDVVSIKEVRATPAPRYETATLDAASYRAGKVPIRAGSEELQVTVSIVWQLA
jgi:uncharacterized protein YggE